MSEPEEKPEEEVTPRDAGDELSNFDTHPAGLHNFGDDPMTNWRLTAIATGGTCEDGKKILGQTFALKYWFIHAVLVTRKDKTRAEAVRTVLMDESGNAFGFVSDGVYQSLRLLVQQLKDHPDLWPVNITVAETQTRSGQRYYSIVPAPERYEEPEKGK